MNKTYDDVKKLIDESDCLLIGAGSGLSTAAGIEYYGKRFQNNFEDFIKKYHFTDMYTSTFYDFPSEEAKWAYFAKHIYINNTGMEATELYKNILKVIKSKDYFVITTNVDDQFYKAGFDKNKIFRVQGSYRYIQCSEACHNKLYDDTDMVKKMLENIDENLEVPTELVPYCPRCGETMEPNLRKDAYFVQDELWYRQNDSYEMFIQKNKHKKMLLMEFGVGFNTPGIIRFPFEQMVLNNPNWKLARFNRDCRSILALDDRVIEFEEDINSIFEK